MTEQARQKFADEIRNQCCDWSFRWVGHQKVFTDPNVEREWQSRLKESKPC